MHPHATHIHNTLSEFWAEVDEFVHASTSVFPQWVSGMEHSKHAKQVRWGWKGNDGEWVLYAPQDAAVIEAAWQKKQQFVQLTVAGKNYKLDLTRKTQVCWSSVL